MSENHVNCRCTATPVVVAPMRHYQSFDLDHPATLEDIKALLARLYKRLVDPGFVAVSRDDYKALQCEIAGALDPVAHPFVILHITNESTGNRVRVVLMSTLEPGTVVFGYLG